MTLLHERFEILEEIGRGSQATTHRALDHDTGEVVALKELDFRRVEDWKSQELFEREGATLQALDHAAIPRYVDAFTIETEDEIRLYLAQEFIDGPTLQDELDSGRHWSEAEAREDAAQLLDALVYLHGLSPPVVHRDIKPSNIIRRSDGRLALVDFGAVQNIVPKTVGGSTIIGTPGYMPIEQVMGRAVPASDLYALGATLIHLLTRTPPSELAVERNHLRFRDRAPSVSEDLATLLEELTHPSVEDRIDSARRARERLERRSIVVSDDLPVLHVPPWATVMSDGVTRIEFNTFGVGVDRLNVTIEDEPGHLELWCTSHGDPDDRRSAYRLATFAAAMVVLAAPPAIAIFTLVALALLAFDRRRSRRARTDVRLQLAADAFVLANGTSRHHGDLSDILEVRAEDNELVLVERDGQRHVALKLPPEDEFRWDWLVGHLNRRIEELRGARTLPAASTEERAEFWMEEPIEVDS